MTVYVSTTSFESRDLDVILAACDEHRLDALELSSVDRYDLSRLGVTDYPSRFLVHNYFPPPAEPFVINLASQDSTLLQRSRAHCRAAIDLSSRLGGAVYAAHAGFTADVSPEILGKPERQAALAEDSLTTYDRAYATLVESARELAEYGRARGVRFLIENHVLAASAGGLGRRLLMMVEADELASLVGDVGHQSFGLLVDVGHLKVSAATLGFDPRDFLDRLGPSIAALHLSDNDGTVDEHRSFGEDAWFMPRLRDFPDAAVTLELSPIAVDRLVAVRDMVARWR